jgi:hypothetical protein
MMFHPNEEWGETHKERERRLINTRDILLEVNISNMLALINQDLGESIVEKMVTEIQKWRGPIYLDLSTASINQKGMSMLMNALSKR